MRTGRRFASLVVAVLAALSSACEDTNPAAPVPSPSNNPTTTETFTGTLPAHSSTWHAFTATASGLMTLTLTSATPVVTVGIGVGTAPTGGCSVQVWNNASAVGTTVTSAINPGAYCAVIYDTGSVTDNVSYTLTVVHP